ncbi:MAG TPA: hypothetical protein VM890_01870 [Longimicrobium sp.]|nr:hypothetical protein [Longimicrobium sp.]
MALSAEELLAGGTLTHELEVPPALLPAGAADGRVVVRPLTVRDLQRIGQAARDDDALSAALMISQALVEPALRVDEVSQLPAGLARFLVERIDEVSGIDTPRDALEELVQAPLARACFVLAREFGWTPEDVSGMTVGQILLYLQMVHGGGEAA